MVTGECRRAIEIRIPRRKLDGISLRFTQRFHGIENGFSMRELGLGRVKNPLNGGGSRGNVLVDRSGRNGEGIDKEYGGRRNGQRAAAAGRRTILTTLWTAVFSRRAGMIRVAVWIRGRSTRGLASALRGDTARSLCAVGDRPTGAGHFFHWTRPGAGGGRCKRYGQQARLPTAGHLFGKMLAHRLFRNLWTDSRPMTQPIRKSTGLPGDKSATFSSQNALSAGGKGSTRG